MNGTGFPELFAALAAPFSDREVKSRQGTGRQFKYVTARTVMNRLDTVLGPENWWDAYATFENCVVCSLTIRMPDGREVTKTDAGGHAGMQDSGDDEKSAYSDGFKRAAAKWGIGRFLYGDGVPRYEQPAPTSVNAPAPVQSQSRTPSPDAEFRLEGEPVVYGKQHPDLATVDKIEESLRKRASKLGQDYDAMLHEICEAALHEGFLTKLPEEPTPTAMLHAAGLVASKVQPQGWLNVTVNTLFPKAEAVA
jgi:hypothetical protein